MWAVARVSQKQSNRFHLHAMWAVAKVSQKQSNRFHPVIKFDMETNMDIQLGDILKMKKTHPCGSNTWEVLRTGTDIRVKCTGCSHQIMLPRHKIEKSIKEITRNQ